MLSKPKSVQVIGRDCAQNPPQLPRAKYIVSQYLDGASWIGLNDPSEYFPIQNLQKFSGHIYRFFFPLE